MLSFSNWTKWTQRNGLRNIDKCPGVYMLAHFDNSPNETIKLVSNIVYIGETCRQTLKIRLNQFARSASTSNEGHSGGQKYYEKFGGVRNTLYVSVYPVEHLDNPIRPFYIRHIERKLLYHYVRKFERPPACNVR